MTQLPQSSSRLKRGDWTLTVTGSLMTVVGSGFLYESPGYLDATAAALRLSPSQIGALSGIESVAVAISGFITARLLKLAGLRGGLALSCTVCLLGDALAGICGDFHHVLISRAAVGLFGEGPLFAASYAMLGASARPDRAYGIAISAVVLFASIVLALQPRLIELGGFGAMLWPLAAMAAVLLPQVLMRRIDYAPGLSPAQKERAVSVVTLILVVAEAVWFGAPGIFWAFAERVARGKTLAPSAIDLAIALGSVAGLAGSALPIFLKNEVSGLRIICAGSLALCVSVVAYLYGHGWTILTMALCGFNIFWNLTVVYQLALMAKTDRTGRSAAMAPSAQILGQGLGPAMGGVLIAWFGNVAIIGGAALFSLVGVLLFRVGQQLYARSTPTLPAKVPAPAG